MFEVFIGRRPGSLCSKICQIPQEGLCDHEMNADHHHFSSCVKGVPYGLVQCGILVNEPEYRDMTSLLAGSLNLSFSLSFTRASRSRRKGSRRSHIKWLLNRVTLYCFINGKLSLRVLAISEMDMLDRFSHSQVQSCRPCRMPSSEMFLPLRFLGKFLL